MGDIVQLRPVRPIRDTICEDDLRRELRAYCDGMKHTLSLSPSNGELEMLISLSSTVNTLLRSMQHRRQLSNLSDIDAELQKWASILEMPQP